MSPRDKIRRARGFTFIEMGAVVVLLALAAALVVPSIARWRDGEERRAFPGELRRLFGSTREEAIESHQARVVRFEESANAFVVTWTDLETNEEMAGGRVSIPQGLELVRLRAGKQDASPGDWLVTFYPDGTSDSAALEFADLGTTGHVSIDERGSVKLNEGPMPELEQERWEAGDLEVRQQAP